MSTVVQNIYADNTQVFALKMTQGLGAISGRVFTDTDGDGTPGTGEPWVVGATVYLDQNKNGVHDPSEITVTSGDFGEYAFTHVSAGTYTVRQVVPTGLVSSAPVNGAYTVTLAADQFLGDRDFGTHSAPVGNVPPVVTSLTTDPKTIIWPGALIMTANGVSDSDGTVRRVEFYRGDVLLGTDEDGHDGWTFPVGTAAWETGPHTLYARGQDNDGAWSEKVSAAVTLWRGTNLDTTAPVAVLSVSHVATVGGTTHVFAITYTDGTQSTCHFWVTGIFWCVAPDRSNSRQLLSVWTIRPMGPNGQPRTKSLRPAGRGMPPIVARMRSG